MQREFTVLVDEREKKPLPIPPFLKVWDRSTSWDRCTPTTVRITTRTVLLPTGDYILEGHPAACIIERKAHLTELHTNVLTVTGRRRFTAELDRLRRECHTPIVLLEGAPHTLKAVRPPIDADLVRDHLLSLLHAYSIGFHLLPTDSPTARRSAGEWLVATLIAAATTTRIPLE